MAFIFEPATPIENLSMPFVVAAGDNYKILRVPLHDEDIVMLWEYPLESFDNGYNGVYKAAYILSDDGNVWVKVQGGLEIPPEEGIWALANATRPASSYEILRGDNYDLLRVPLKDRVMITLLEAPISFIPRLSHGYNAMYSRSYNLEKRPIMDPLNHEKILSFEWLWTEIASGPPLPPAPKSRRSENG